jgi:hypothetical protein
MYNFEGLQTCAVVLSHISIDFKTDNALACGSGIFTVPVNTTVPWVIYNSR